MSVASTISIVSRLNVSIISAYILSMKLHSGNRITVNAPAKWWFSNGDLSLYRMARISDALIKKSLFSPPCSKSCTIALMYAARWHILSVTVYPTPPRVSITCIDYSTSAECVRLWYGLSG